MFHLFASLGTELPRIEHVLGELYRGKGPLRWLKSPESGEDGTLRADQEHEFSNVRGFVASPPTAVFGGECRMLNSVFQQNRAPIHTSKVIEEFFDRFGSTPPFRPPKSPDLGVIENCLGYIKAALAKHNVTTLAKIEILVSKL